MSNLPVTIPDYSIFVTNPYILTQFLDKATPSQLQQFFDWFSPGANELEACLQGMILGLLLTNAVGVQLDNIGSEVGISRNGASDSTFRALIYMQCVINTGGGDSETIITILRSTVGSTDIALSFMFPAKILIAQTSSFTIWQLQQILLPAMPSGVGFGFNCFLIDNNGNFIVDNNGNFITVNVFTAS